MINQSSLAIALRSLGENAQLPGWGQAEVTKRPAYSVSPTYRDLTLPCALPRPEGKVRTRRTLSRPLAIRRQGRAGRWTLKSDAASLPPPPPSSPRLLNPGAVSPGGARRERGPGAVTVAGWLSRQPSVGPFLLCSVQTLPRRGQGTSWSC